MLKPRKRFGQNFLTDTGVISRIVTAINPKPGEQIIEIGPGHGALTRALVQSGCNLRVIEIDRDLTAALREAYPSLEVINADVLKTDFGDLLAAGPARIVGNLPYNISTPLLFKLFEHVEHITDMHFMLQLEVVNRICAAPSTNDFGRLSVMAQFHCNPRKLFGVPPEAFSPRPRVESAIVRLLPNNPPRVALNPTLLGEVVRQAFSQRRKTVRNALSSVLDETELLSLSIDPKSRPENLTLSDYIAISNAATRRETAS